MTLLALDPGETVGWAVFDGMTKVKGGQTDWGQFIEDLSDSYSIGASRYKNGRPFNGARAIRGGPFTGVDEIVMEDFVLYPEGVSSGPPPPWDHLITPRIIGAVQFIADVAHVPVEYQGASIKSDALAAAAAEDFARPLYENRHENDATMHGTYFNARRMVKG